LNLKHSDLELLFQHFSRFKKVEKSVYGRHLRPGFLFWGRFWRYFGRVPSKVQYLLHYRCRSSALLRVAITSVTNSKNVITGPSSDRALKDIRHMSWTGLFMEL